MPPLGRCHCIRQTYDADRRTRQDIAFPQYLAMLSAADALMITSLRDGMNLACHEYIVCQNGDLPNGKKHGPLVLSEFTGAATVFDSADILPVNPWHYAACARGIKQALEMSTEEKEVRKWTYRR